jgi:hypothetical protein
MQEYGVPMTGWGQLYAISNWHLRDCFFVVSRTPVICVVAPQPDMNTASVSSSNALISPYLRRIDKMLVTASLNLQLKALIKQHIMVTKVGVNMLDNSFGIGIPSTRTRYFVLTQREMEKERSLSV